MASRQVLALAHPINQAARWCTREHEEAGQ